MREEGGRKTSSFLTPKVQLAGLLMAGGGVVAGATMLGFFGRFGWLLDLCSHFHAQYAGYLALVVVLSCLPRKFRTAWIFPPVPAKIEWQGATVTFLGTHPVPPISAQYARMRGEQLRAVALHSRSLDGAALLMGDLSTTLWSYHFRHLLDVSGLSDCNRGYGCSPPGTPAIR